MPRRLIVILIAALVLGPAASARAAWFPAAPIEGPNADILSIGNVDLARDGTGAIAYVRNDGDVPHAFLSRISGGAWRAPERVDPTAGAVTEVKVAAGDGNRLAIAWVADGNVYATVAPGGEKPGAFAPTVQLGGPGASSLDVDLGVNGAAYAVWQQGGDVRAARLQDSTWSGVALPLDIDPALESGTGALRPRVAVSAEGYAVATWGDKRPDGTTHVCARRITGMNLSLYPQDLTLPTGSADSPDIDIEDDGSFAWVVFRQDMDGTSRTVARRLVGSQFEAPELIDGIAPAFEPRIDMSDRGAGLAVSETIGGQVVGAWLDHDHFQPPLKLDINGSVTPPHPEVATTERKDIAIAWRMGLADGNSVARARFKAADEPFGGEVTISRGDLGPVADPGVYIGGDRLGDIAVAMVQGAPGARALTVGVFDRPPSAPYIPVSQSYKRKSRPELKWRQGLDLWGAPTFRIYLDGVVIGQTTKESLVPAQPIASGKHVWQVEQVDRAGQTSRSRARTLRIDSVAPTLKVSVGGKRAAGKALKITVRAADPGGSGLDHVTVDYGDRSPTTRTRTSRHSYRRGSFTLKVAAVDKVGNVARKAVKLRIKKS